VNISAFELDGNCAALYIDRPGDISYSRVWYHGFLDSPSYPLPITATDAVHGIREGTVPIGEFFLGAEEAGEILDELDALTGPGSCLGEDPRLFCWGGVRRIFSRMASIIPHRYADVAALADRAYDPEFQFIRTLGFPIRLENAALVMLDEDISEPEDLSVAHARDTQDVARALGFMAHRVETTSRLIKWIQHEGAVRWETRKGTTARRELDGWRSVRALREMIYGTDADGKPIVDPARRWPDYDGQWDLHKITGWMKGEF
jgi:hypothetical protein